jgi:hypothetical protein
MSTDESSIKPKVNGTAELKELPVWCKTLIIVLRQFGLATAIVVAVMIGAAYWGYNVVAPEARARVKAWDQMGDAAKEGVENGKKQSQILQEMQRQQAEWKTYTAEQDRQRKEENATIHGNQKIILTNQKLILEAQDHQSEQWKNTMRVHEQQIKLLQEMTDTVKRGKQPGG